MSSGYGANWAWTVSEEFVAKMGRLPYEAFRAFTKLYDIDGIGLAKLLSFEDDEDYVRECLEDSDKRPEEDEESAWVDARIDELKALWQALKDRFAEATRCEDGSFLTLDLVYHDSNDEGSCYDDVDGFAWCVGGHQKPTRAGEKFESEIDLKTYVTFG